MNNKIVALFLIISISLILIILCIKSRENIHENYDPYKYYNKAISNVIETLNELELEWWLTEGTLIGALRYGGNFGQLSNFEQAVDSDIDVMVRAHSQEHWKILAPIIGQKLLDLGWGYYKITHTENQTEFNDKLYVSFSLKNIIGPFDLHADIHMYQVDENKNIAHTLDKCRDLTKKYPKLYPFGNWGGRVPYKGFIVDDKGNLGKCLHNGKIANCPFQAVEFLNGHYGKESEKSDTCIPNEKIEAFTRKSLLEKFKWEKSPKFTIQDLYCIYNRVRDIHERGFQSYYNDIKKLLNI